jgi:hypothetical protein
MKKGSTSTPKLTQTKAPTKRVALRGPLRPLFAMLVAQQLAAGYYHVNAQEVKPSTQTVEALKVALFGADVTSFGSAAQT